MSIQKTYKNIITSILVFSFVFLPFGEVFAATPEETRAADDKAFRDNIRRIDAMTDPQLDSLNGSTKSGTSTTSAGTNAATELLGCTAGGLLARVIAGGITVLLNGLLGSTVGALLNVPVSPDNSQTGKGQQLQQAAETGIHIFGVPTGVSWNGIAFCIVNSIISYIADSTIEWANNGFNGNPAFIQNPDRFFKSMADREAGNFIQQLAYDTTGINVCEPFRARIAIGLANAYGNNYQRQAGCSLDQIRSNVDNFAQNPIEIGVGDSRGSAINQRRSNPGLPNYFPNLLNARRSNNNVVGSYILANQHMYAGITRANNTATFEIGLNKGWLSTKKCVDENDPNTCNIVSPGSILQSSLEKTLGIPKDRLVLATRFDQVVTVIVNNLIKVALNKVLEKRDPGSVDTSSGITSR